MTVRKAKPPRPCLTASERLMYCGTLGQHSACRQAGVPVGTLTRRKRQPKNILGKEKMIWKTDLSELKMWLRN